MRQLILAAAALALAACNQGGSGAPLPRLQDGAQAPSTQTPQPGARQATNIDDATRQALLENIDEMLDGMTQQSGMAATEGVEDMVAPMQPGTDHRSVVTLNSGAYTIVGACDGDCTNMDIELISMATGGVVASDMLPDDFPVVNYTVAENGQYMVRMLMQACSVAPCYGGARVLTNGAALQPLQSDK
jgi:hypothetical protein